MAPTESFLLRDGFRPVDFLRTLLISFLWNHLIHQTELSLLPVIQIASFGHESTPVANGRRHCLYKFCHRSVALRLSFLILLFIMADVNVHLVIRRDETKGTGKKQVTGRGVRRRLILWFFGSFFCSSGAGGGRSNFGDRFRLLKLFSELRFRGECLKRWVCLILMIYNDLLRVTVKPVAS